MGAIIDNSHGKTTNLKQGQSIDQIITKVELSAEIARIALSCPTCKGTVRELIQNENVNVNPVRGRSSLQAMNESKDDLTNVHYTSKYK